MINKKMKVEVKPVGNNPVTVFELYVDGESLATVKRKWLAVEIARAIEAGQIEKTGYVQGRFEQWAYLNARELFNRIR